MVHYVSDMPDNTTAIVVGDAGHVLRWSSATAGVPAIAKKSVAITVHPSPTTDLLMLDSNAPFPWMHASSCAICKAGW